MGQKQSIEHSNLQILGTIYRHKAGLLKSVLVEFAQINLYPKIGIEIEFYLQDSKSKLAIGGTKLQEFISQLKFTIKKSGIDVLNIEPEQGFGQVEIKTNPYLDLDLLCKEVLSIKEIAINLAKTLNYDANFLSQPYQNDCGSSLQINFSLIDHQNNYLFAKAFPENEYLLRSIAALLEFANNIMIIFAPKEADYLRFCKATNINLFKNKKYCAPTNVSWGYDNRTALVRIPPSQNDRDRRLEFRLGASDADIYLSVTFFLLVILESFSDNQKLIAPTYGNVFDEQYLLENLPQNYQAAEDRFFAENKILEMVRKMLLKFE